VSGAGNIGIGVIGRVDLTSEYEVTGVALGPTYGFGGGFSVSENRPSHISYGGYSELHEYYGFPRPTSTYSRPFTHGSGLGRSGGGSGNNYTRM